MTRADHYVRAIEYAATLCPVVLRELRDGDTVATLSARLIWSTDHVRGLCEVLRRLGRVEYDGVSLWRV